MGSMVNSKTKAEGAWWRRARGLSLLGLAGLAAGCQTAVVEPPTLSTTTSPELSAIELTMAVPKPPPSGDALRTTLTVPRPKIRPSDLEPPEPEFAASEPVAMVTVMPLSALEPILPVEPAMPINVVGLSEDATVELLGPPVWRNWRPPSRVLRYATSDCTVDIYFYLDVVTDTFQALQIRAPVAPVDAEELESCLGKVRNEHRIKDLESN